MDKISVLLPERENARFCDYCRTKGYKKSTFIAHLIKEHLDRESFSTEAHRGRVPTQPKISHSARRGHVRDMKSGRTS
jgi:hypothetical protein